MKLDLEGIDPEFVLLMKQAAGEIKIDNTENSGEGDSGSYQLEGGSYDMNFDVDPEVLQEFESSGGASLGTDSSSIGTWMGQVNEGQKLNFEQKLNELIIELLYILISPFSIGYIMIDKLFERKKEDFIRYIESLLKTSLGFSIGAVLLFILGFRKFLYFKLLDTIIASAILFAVSFGLRTGFPSIMTKKKDEYQELVYDETINQEDTIEIVDNEVDDVDHIDDEIEYEEMDSNTFEDYNTDNAAIQKTPSLEEISALVESLKGNLPILDRRVLYELMLPCFPTTGKDIAYYKEYSMGDNLTLAIAGRIRQALIDLFPSKDIQNQFFPLKLIERLTFYELYTQKVKGLKIQDLINNAPTIASYLKDDVSESIQILISELGDTYIFRILKPEYSASIGGSAKEKVTYGDALASKIIKEKFLSNSYKIPFPVGIGFDGELIFVDYDNLVHSLIVGITGGGKSWFISMLLLNIFAFNPPTKYIGYIFDPKPSSLFKSFEGMPHLKKFITTEEEAELLFRFLSNEFQIRQRFLTSVDCENLFEYNKKYGPDIGTVYPDMPYIIVFMDEIVAVVESIATRESKEEAKKFKGLLNMLAVKYRSAGLKLILSTQRPTNDFIDKTTRLQMGFKLVLGSGKSEIEFVHDKTYNGPPLTSPGDGILSINNGELRPVKVFALSNGDDSVAKNTIKSVTMIWNKLNPKVPQLLITRYEELASKFEAFGKDPIARQLYEEAKAAIPIFDSVGSNEALTYVGSNINTIDDFIVDLNNQKTSFNVSYVNNSNFNTVEQLQDNNTINNISSNDTIELEDIDTDVYNSYEEFELEDVDVIDNNYSSTFNSDIEEVEYLDNYDKDNVDIDEQNDIEPDENIDYIGSNIEQDIDYNLKQSQANITNQVSSNVVNSAKEVIDRTINKTSTNTVQSNVNTFNQSKNDSVNRQYHQVGKSYIDKDKTNQYQISSKGQTEVSRKISQNDLQTAASRFDYGNRYNERLMGNYEKVSKENILFEDNDGISSMAVKSVIDEIIEVVDGKPRILSIREYIKKSGGVVSGEKIRSLYNQEDIENAILNAEVIYNSNDDTFITVL